MGVRWGPATGAQVRSTRRGRHGRGLPAGPAISAVSSPIIPLVGSLVRHLKGAGKQVDPRLHIFTQDGLSIDDHGDILVVHCTLLDVGEWGYVSQVRRLPLAYWESSDPCLKVLSLSIAHVGGSGNDLVGRGWTKIDQPYIVRSRPNV